MIQITYLCSPCRLQKHRRPPWISSWTGWVTLCTGGVGAEMLQDTSLRRAAGDLFNRFTNSEQGPRLERMTAQLNLEVLRDRVSEAMKRECTDLRLFAAGAHNVVRGPYNQTLILSYFFSEVYLALLKDQSDVLLRVMPEMQTEKFRLLGVFDEDVASHECEASAPRLAGSSHLSWRTQIATYEWVRTHTTIPVPIIYGSGTKPQPYIVMERVRLCLPTSSRAGER